MSWLKGMGARARLLFGRGAAESRMEEEMRFHLEMEADRLARAEGLSRQEAMRRARIAFGGQEKYREELREGRGLAWLSGLQLDLKLGARMLLKYPVLTGASVLALAIAVALAASWFEFMTDVAHPRIPLPEAERLVLVENRDLEARGREMRSLHDFEVWREEVRSVADLTALSSVEFNVTTDEGRYATVRGARVTEAMFRLVGVQPRLGRALAPADFDPAATPVVVIGHDAWQRLFDGDRAVIGRSVKLAAEHATVVGVMPPGFGFPVNQELWAPLRDRASSYGPREGPSILMVGRLAPGASLDDAQAELAVLGDRRRAEWPATHSQLRPHVRRLGVGDDLALAARLFNLPFLLFLIVVSANVATLLFARTAARQGELAMRSALGASRRRIVVQLVSEALVLTVVAAALGLGAVSWGLRGGMELFWEVQQTRPPFWFDPRISAPTVIYVLLLAVIGATIIGAIPGLRATGQQLRARLTQPGTGEAGMRFGAIATGIIIVQVALCVSFIPVAIMNGQSLLPEREESAFPAEEFLTGRLLRQHERPVPATQAGLRRDPETAALYDEVHRRLAVEPGVLAVTKASRMPGFNHPVEDMEVEGSDRGIYARPLAVDPNFFDVMGARVVAGRAFSESDVASSAGVAIVDQAWAKEMFGASSPLGQRIRYPQRPGERGTRWYEIVGVVAGMDRATGPGEHVGVFHPLRTEEHAGVQLYVRTASLPEALAPQVHTLVTAVDPSLGIADFMSLQDAWAPVLRSDRFFAAALTVVAVIILLFALMGIYALMSFTVAQRAREIGIRAALGADPRRIIAAIFSRALLQIGLGIVAGATLVSLTVARSPEGIRLVGSVAAAMIVVGLMGCLIPATRALRIQPTDALRAE